MKFFIFFLFLIIPPAFSQELRFHPIEIDTSYSFRGLSVVDDSVAWVSGNGFGRSVNGGENWKFSKVSGYEKSCFLYCGWWEQLVIPTKCNWRLP